MDQVKAPRYRVANPVIDGSFSEHRSLTPVPDALDEFGIVVRGLWILVHVHRCKTLHPRPVHLVAWVRQAQKHQSAHSFAGVEPVRLRDELLVIGAVGGERRQLCPEFAVWRGSAS